MRINKASTCGQSVRSHGDARRYHGRYLRSSFLAGAGILAITASAVPALAEDSLTTASAAIDGGIETVVVTARHRDEKAQDIPVSLTVLSGKLLEDSGTDKLTQLQFEAPSLGATLINPRNTQVIIRGIGSNPANDGLTGSVGIYLDGVYLERQGMASTNLYDIAQIEVLRGPQGTLFGKNTTAGALNITTNKPTFVPEASAEVSYGSYNTLVLKGTVSGPLVGNVLAGRLSIYDEHHDGYITSPNGGPYDDLNRQGVKGQLLYQPTNAFSLRFISDYSREGDHGGFQLLYSKGSPSASIPYSTWSAKSVVTAIVDPDNPWKTNANKPQVMRSGNWGSSLEANWTSPGGYTLTSISAVRYFEFTPHNNSGLTVYAPTATAPLFSSNANVYDLQASQEFRLASPVGGPVDYVVGSYYFWKKLNGKQRNNYGNLYSALTGTKNAALDNALLSYDSRFRTNSAAIFGQANWHITEKLTLTGGIRETYQEDSEHFIRFGLTGGTGTAPTNTIPYDGQGFISDWSTGGLVSLAYKIADDVLGYVSASHGSKAGGFIGATTPTQTGTSFADFSTLKLRPEASDDAEVGIKSSWFDQRLVVNANAFFTRVGNYQVAASVTTPTGLTAAGVNVKSIVSKGVEVEVTAVPIDGLSINASTSYDHANYGSFLNAPVVQGSTAKYQDLSGRPVNNVPRWTANISGTYTAHLAENIEGFVSAEYAYKSGQYGYIDDSSYSWIKAYGLANFRLGANIADHYEAFLWVRNAFNTPNFDVTGQLSGNLGGYYASVGAPRVFGGTVRVTF